MNEIKAYLLRLILCGFLVSLTGALLRGKRAGRVVALCGGCLLILTAVEPLLRVDLSRLPDLVTGLTQSQRQSQAREKNDALLRRLVEEQTEAWIETQAETLGMTVAVQVEARRAGESLFVPDSVSISGTWTEAQRTALAVILLRELAIPEERQVWNNSAA